jgi:hypothetical protein
MVRPGGTRHGTNGRVLALFLIAAQFLLFTVHGLAHLHASLSGPTEQAALSHCGPAVSVGLHQQPTIRAVPHGATADCPVCRVAQSTVSATAATPEMVSFASLCGAEPVYSSLLPPSLTLGPSSARAPPVL